VPYFSVSPRNGKYCCQVRWIQPESGERKSKNKTFKNKASAKAWGRLQEDLIEKSISQGQDFSNNHTSLLLLRDLLEKYLSDEHVDMGRSKRYSLEAIKEFDIANTKLFNLKPKHIVDFCKERKSGGASPATIACDISHIRAVLRSAKALYEIDVNTSSIVEAMPTLRILGLIGKSNIRTRRPSKVEIKKLKNGLTTRQDHTYSTIPFTDILDFSILSCMRISEVCSIVWDDLNTEESWVWVRNRKDPRKKIGNHMKVPLLGGALKIALRQKRDKKDNRIFPYNPRSITAGFQRVRNELKIQDLRYHDLRREGASRLFELGYSVDQVAQVTGHKDLNTLWRIYTDLNPDRFIEK
jgi:integrase